MRCSASAQWQVDLVCDRERARDAPLIRDRPNSGAWAVPGLQRSTRALRCARDTLGLFNGHAPASEERAQFRDRLGAGPSL